LCFILGCKTESSKSATKQNKISELKTTELQSAFLMEIFTKDQQVRKQEQTAIQNYGNNSDEHQAAINNLMKTDDQNLIEIEEYLKVHGHPKRDVHGREACDTPWLVIHHASAGKGVRKKHFQTFYEAYKKGEIHGNALAMYLNRMYNLQFNSQIEWNRPYRVEEEIDTLINTLGLQSLTD